MRIYDEMNSLIQEMVNTNIENDINTIGEVINEHTEFCNDMVDIKLAIYEKERAGEISKAERSVLLEKVESTYQELESMVCEYTIEERINVLQNMIDQFKDALNTEESKEEKNINRINDLKRRINETTRNLNQLKMDKEREESRSKTAPRARSSYMMRAGQSRRSAYA